MIYTITVNPSLDLEYVVEEIKYNHVIQASGFRIDLGGKGFNVSQALNLIDVENIALGFVGGKIGELLSERITLLKIKQDLIQINHESRINTSILLNDKDNYIKVNSQGPRLSKQEQSKLVNKVQKIARKGDWFVISGSLPLDVHPKYYATLIEMIQTKGAKSVLDTSGQELISGVQASPDLIKPNRSEMEELTQISLDSPGNWIRAIKCAHQMGAKVVCLTLGREGAILSNGKMHWKAKPPPIHERNPIAAGDAFLAGLVARLSQKPDYGEALAWGTACGAAAASRDGTSFGDKREIEKLVNSVIISTHPYI